MPGASAPRGILVFSCGRPCSFFFQAEDGIRDLTVTGVQTCALPISEGLRLQFHQIVTRNLLRFVDSLPLFYFVGGLVSWLSPKCQRLGDLADNTIVIRSPRISEPDLDQLLAGKFNSLRQYPHLAARLRHRVSPAEAAV